MLEQQQLRLLYLLPETLLSAPVWERGCQLQLKINGFIVDEVHCLDYGEHFDRLTGVWGAVRPVLLKTKPSGTQIAIAAFTATADSAQANYSASLTTKTASCFPAKSYRQNLHLKVQTIWTPRGRRQQLLPKFHWANQGCWAIHVRSRRDSESLPNG